MDRQGNSRHRRKARTIAFLAAMAVGALSPLCIAGPAAAASFFDANPATLGAIDDGTSSTPCNPGAPRLVNFDVAGLQAPITDVRVSFAFAPTHMWVGDLVVVLNGPSGIGSQSIFGRTGATTSDGFGDSSDLLGLYTFSDSAPALPKWWDAATTAGASTAIPIGSYRASTQGGEAAGGTSTLITPTFASLANPNGTWTLKFIDCASPYTTSVTAATLGLTTPSSGSSLKTQVSNQFSFRKLKLNKDKGTATLTVKVSGAGTLALGGKGIVKQRLAARAATASKAVGGPGKVNLKIKSKGAKKATLNRTGKVTVKAKVTFTPTGGTAATHSKKFTLKKNL